jgi:hypothetical protein
MQPTSVSLALAVAVFAVGCSRANPVAPDPAAAVAGSAGLHDGGLAIHSEHRATRSVSELRRFSDETIVPDSSSTLLRNRSGITMTIHTSELEPRAAYTIWWVIFNQPDACAGDPCGLGDLFDMDVQASVLFAAGHVVPPSGKGNFAASLRAGGPTRQVLFGPALLDSRHAEVHLVVRSHGQPIPGLVHDQIGSFEGGCDINTCEDVQFAIHK